MYHTGIVEKVAGGRVYTIEGNTSSAAGVVENGGCVQDKSYPLTYSKIGGYGRPDFSIVPEEDNDMDQTKFNEMFVAAMAEHRKQLRDNDSGDWSQKAREWAVSVGLFAGNGTLDNGEPNMMWEDFLTREPGRPALLSFRLGAWAGVMGRGKRLAQARAHRRLEFSKRLVADIRALLWVVTIGGLALAAYCIRVGYTGSLPWISAMVGLPWTAHGVVCSFYLSLCKSDHREGGITFESAKAKGFQEAEGSENSPAI